jgi:hypothetical protein
MNEREKQMERVKMFYMGKLAEVDSDQIKKLQRKEALVAQALALRNSASELSAHDHREQASVIISKIIRLNRSIRSTVRFL